MLLDVLSRLREEDHVELLPFHGCDESKVTPVQCAEQILAERNSVKAAYLISGTQSCIKFKKQPSQPVVSTLIPSQQLHILRPGNTVKQHIHTGLQIYGGQWSLSHDFKIPPITFQGSGTILFSCGKISL